MARLLSLLVFVPVLFAPSVVFADEVIVRIGHNRIEPAELRVAPGTTVVFRNQDEMPGGHTVVADDGSFESPALGKDDTWSHTFDEAGTYSYSIKEHSSAKGQIIVE